VEPWCTPPPDTLVGARFVEAFRAVGLDVPNRKVLTSSIQLYIGLLATEHFLTILPDSLLWFSGKRLGIKALPIKVSVQPRSIGIVTLKNRTINPAARLFTQMALIGRDARRLSRQLSGVMRTRLVPHRAAAHDPKQTQVPTVPNCPLTRPKQRSPDVWCAKASQFTGSERGSRRNTIRGSQANLSAVESAKAGHHRDEHRRDSCRSILIMFFNCLLTDKMIAVRVTCNFRMVRL
jgi:LysR substrate binding domain